MEIKPKKYIKYSENFERDFYFYTYLIDRFDFSGKITQKSEQSDNGKSLKECFYYYDTNGKLYPCKMAFLLDKLLFAKAALNWQIKQWSEGIADGTSTYNEIVGHINEKYNYDFPEWVYDAIYKQSIKLTKMRLIKIMK